MSNKNQQKNAKTRTLEQDVKDKELEYEAIKEAIEKGDINLLSNFKTKGIKGPSKFSAKIPKKLSEKEKEKRDEIRRLKEAEDLAQIQQKLFRQVKGRRKIEPLYNKKGLYSHKDIFASNLDKECEKILIKDEKHNKHKKNEIAKSHNNMNNENVILKKKYKIDCDKIIKETDEEKDNEYLNELDKDIKNFYIEKCGEIFNFLKEIHLCRYIDEFLKRGLDIYEEFIEIKEDFFKNMKEPFLNESQQKKFFTKLHDIKNDDKNNKQIKQINNIHQNNEIINQNNILNKPNGQKNIENNKDVKTSPIDNININQIISKAQKLTEIDIQTSPQNKNQNIIKDTSAKISPEELMYRTSNDIEFLEQKRSEEFKKAVENWRNNNISSRPNTSHLSMNNKITSEIGININQPLKQKIMSYCWNCYKKFVKEEGVSKEYTNNFHLNEKYNTKNFCSLKCNKDYEKKQRSQFMCFECKKMCNLMNGFIAFEGNKFCSNNCKNKYIEEEKKSMNNQKKKNKKNKIKKDKSGEIQNEPNIEISNEVKEETDNKEKEHDKNIEKDEEDYDPMDDF
jgi:hypothetical protein